MDRLKNRWIVVAFQVALGVIFVWASYHKIVDPPKFAKDIYNYKVTPGGLVNMVAIYLPWLELVAGILLIVGVLDRGATLLVGGMLIVFIAALGFNYLRGHPIDCACFVAAGTKEKTTDEMLSEMVVRIVQDVGMLLMVGYVLWCGRTSRPWFPGWRQQHQTVGEATAQPAAS